MNKKMLYIFLFILVALGAFLTNRFSSKPQIFSEKTESKIQQKAVNFKQAFERKILADKQQIQNNQPLITRERQYTEKEIEMMSEGQFKDLLSEVKRKLPKKTELKTIPAHALHTTPPVIMEAGKNLGLIKEILFLHPQYQDEAIIFYEECAKDESSPTTIRALCLTNLSQFKKNTNFKNFPKEIVDLAKIVMEN